MSSNGLANLIPAEPGNTRAHKHGIWSSRLREPRAQELYDALMCAPHLVESLDSIAVMELARVHGVPRRNAGCGLPRRLPDLSGCSGRCRRLSRRSPLTQRLPRRKLLLLIRC
jgi:hypothetical protein